MLPINRIAAFHNDMISWRHDIHCHPERAYEEHRTAGKVVALLRAFGLDEVIAGVGRTGVVGTLRNGKGPAIGLRADMDALPIQELSEQPYRSCHHGIMHACGHDGHTAMLLGAARYLAETRAFCGTVVLVFQPAEEGAAGALAMLDDGLFERFPVDSIYGLHNLPGLPVGSIAVSGGAVMAAADHFEILFHGYGGHAATPHLTRDPLLAAAAAVQALQAVVSRNVAPAEALVVSVTEFHAGDAFNVIPDSARCSGTVRYFAPSIGILARQRLEQMISSVGTAYDVTVDFHYHLGYPPTINSEQAATLLRSVAAEIVGIKAVSCQKPLMYAEDFSYFLQRKTGAYAFIGNGDDATCYGLHNPRYDFNDALLPIGASVFSRLVETVLGQ